MKKEVDLTIRLNSELKTQIKKRASLVGLSVSSYVRVLIIKDLQE